MAAILSTGVVLPCLPPPNNRNILMISILIQQHRFTYKTFIIAQHPKSDNLFVCYLTSNHVYMANIYSPNYSKTFNYSWALRHLVDIYIYIYIYIYICVLCPDTHVQLCSVVSGQWHIPHHRLAVVVNCENYIRLCRFTRQSKLYTFV